MEIIVANAVLLHSAFSLLWKVPLAGLAAVGFWSFITRGRGL